MIEYKVVSFGLDLMGVGRSVTPSFGVFKEYDNVKLRITVNNGEKPVSLDSKVIKLFARKPDKEPVYQEKNISIVDPRNGVVEIVLTKAMLNVIGDVRAELELINIDGSLVTTNTFIIKVVDKLNDLNTDEEVGENVEFLKEIQEFITLTRPEEEKRQANELIRTRAENTRLAAEEIREANELLRQKATEDMLEAINVAMSNTEIDSIVSNALNG